MSHIAQLETATKWAESKGYEIVGTFEDLGLSVEKRSEDRPDLGPWLTDEGSAKLTPTGNLQRLFDLPIVLGRG